MIALHKSYFFFVNNVSFVFFICHIVTLKILNWSFVARNDISLLRKVYNAGTAMMMIDLYIHIVDSLRLQKSRWSGYFWFGKQISISQRLVEMRIFRFIGIHMYIKSHPNSSSLALDIDVNLNPW